MVSPNPIPVCTPTLTCQATVDTLNASALLTLQWEELGDTLEGEEGEFWTVTVRNETRSFPASDTAIIHESILQLEPVLYVDCVGRYRCLVSISAENESSFLTSSEVGFDEIVLEAEGKGHIFIVLLLSNIILCIQKSCSPPQLLTSLGQSFEACGCF